MFVWMQRGDIKSGLLVRPVEPDAPPVPPVPGTFGLHQVTFEWSC